MTVFLFTVLFF